MKLRLQGSSLRLRLRQGEVRRLLEEGSVEERTEFHRASFVYALRAADVEAVSASFEQNRLVVSVPRAAARHWAAGDQVGIDASQPTPSGGVLRILVEKDYECIDAPPGESQEDAFPNPRGGKC